jgi:alkylation response protein AidB-like acyl-CoA dehydrogenase
VNFGDQAHGSGLIACPIRQSTDHGEFSEIFLDGVRVSDETMLGAPGDGWRLAMTTVTLERGPADNGYVAKHLALVERLEQLGSAVPYDQADRQALARSYVDVEVLRIRVQQSLAERVGGAPVGPESSVDKLLMIKTEQALHHLALHVACGRAVIPDDPEWIDGYLHSRAASIYGGTEQIQRSIVAQRVLGLPRD